MRVITPEDARLIFAKWSDEGHRRVLCPQRSPKTGSSAHLVKGEDERVGGAPAALAGLCGSTAGFE